MNNIDIVDMDILKDERNVEEMSKIRLKRELLGEQYLKKFILLFININKF